MSTIIATDPIADMLARIRNAIAVRKSVISLPYSKVKEAIARQLLAAAYITDVTVEGEGLHKLLVVSLRREDANAPITSIKRLSRPGRRQYVSAEEIPIVRRGRGIVIVSTSQGVMTGNAAKKLHIGGELICEVY